MTTIEVRFDAAVFSLETVTRAAHRYTDGYFVQVESGTAGLLIRLTPKSGRADASHLAELLRNDVLDEQLRTHVRNETSELHTALIGAALHPVLAKFGRKS